MNYKSILATGPSSHFASSVIVRVLKKVGYSFFFLRWGTRLEVGLYWRLNLPVIPAPASATGLIRRHMYASRCDVSICLVPRSSCAC